MNRRTKKEYIPSTSEIKILDTVYFLNEKKLYPLSGGVYKILIGSEEKEYEAYQAIPTYGTLLSLSTKHISRLIMMLLRYKYLTYKFDKETEELYLEVSPKGLMFLSDYHKKHKYKFKKKEKNNAPLIVRIED